MSTVNEDSFAPWRKFNPLVARHKRMWRAVWWGFALIVVNMFAVLHRLKDQAYDLDVPLSTTDAILSVSFMFGLFLWVASFSIVAFRVSKAQASAVRKWAAQAHPDPLLLARMSVSEEIDEPERSAAKSLLNKDNPHWRGHVLQDPLAAGSSSRIEVPSFPSTPKREAKIEIALTSILAVIVLGGVGLAFTGHFLLVGLAVILASSLIMALHVLTERPAEQRRRAWEQDLLQHFSLEELVAFESANSETLEGRLIHRLLDNTHPGWTLTPARPLWKVACDC